LAAEIASRLSALRADGAVTQTERSLNPSLPFSRFKLAAKMGVMQDGRGPQIFFGGPQ